MEVDLGCGNKKKLWYFEADGEVYLHESTPDEEDFKVHKPTQSIEKLEEKKSSVEEVSENLDVTIYGDNTSCDKFLEPTSNENLDVTIFGKNTISDKFLEPTFNGIISMISIISYVCLYMQRLFTTLSTSGKGIKIVEFLVTALLLLSPMVASKEGQVNSTVDISVGGPVMVGEDVSLYCKCTGDCIGYKRWTGGQNYTDLTNNNHVIQEGIILLENSEDRYSMKISHATGKYIDFKLTCFFGSVSKDITLDVHKAVSSKPPPTQSTVTSTSSSEQPKKGGLSDGAIAEIVVGAVGLVAAIAIIVCIICRVVFQRCNCRSPYKEEVAQTDNVYEL